MGYEQTELNRRLARNSADAASDYATAAVAAYAHMAQQTMNFWLDALHPRRPEPQPRSWYRPPADVARRTAPLGSVASAQTPFAWMGLAAWAPWMAGKGDVQRGFFPLHPFAAHPLAAWQRNAVAPMLSNPMPDPFTLWLRAWPLQGPPAAWPMAFALLVAGWPREVAYPTARANLAVMDAVQTAGKVVDETFSSYRTDNGFATAQVQISFEKAASTAASGVFAMVMLAPLASMVAAPPTA